MPSKIPGDQNPLTSAITSVFESLMRSVMVCLPGHVVSFDPSNQLAVVQCGVQRVADGEGVDIPIIENVPVKFSGDGEWYFWHQITEGTEGVVLFSQRAIDLWIERGGVIKPHDLRMFNESDAFFIPGIRSKVGAIQGFKNEGVGMSNASGTEYIHLKQGVIEVKTGELNIEAATNIVGDVATEGALTNDNINVGSDHKHDGSPTAPTGPKSPTGEPLP